MYVGIYIYIYKQTSTYITMGIEIYMTIHNMTYTILYTIMQSTMANYAVTKYIL